jgi:hypothetical protein
VKAVDDLAPPPIRMGDEVEWKGMNRYEAKKKGRKQEKVDMLFLLDFLLSLSLSPPFCYCSKLCWNLRFFFLGAA